MKRQLRWAGLSRTRAKVDQLITIDDFDSFIDIREFPPSTITADILNSVHNLDEREELEPFIRSILFDTSACGSFALEEFRFEDQSDQVILVWGVVP